MQDSAPATAADASRYLIEENGWTREELQAFLDSMAPWDYPTTKGAWTEAATAYNRRQAEERWPLGHDVAPCLDREEHVPSTRHAKHVCPVVVEQDARDEMDRAEEARLRVASEGTL